MHDLESKTAASTRGWRKTMPFVVTVTLFLMILLPNIVSLQPLDSLYQSSAYLIFFMLFNVLTMITVLCLVKSSRFFFLLLSPFAFLALPFALGTMMFESVPGRVMVQVSLGTTAREIYGLINLFGWLIVLPVIYGLVYIGLVFSLKESVKIEKTQRTSLVAILAIYIGSAIVILQYHSHLKINLPVFKESMVSESFPLGLLINVWSSLKVEDHNPKNYEALALSSIDSAPTEVTVLVIGESVRSDHLSINGYYRPTTPRLLARKDELVTFPDMMSFSNNTQTSVPGILTVRKKETDNFYSLIETYRQAGYQTVWISNQVEEIFNPNADYQEFADGHWKELFRQDTEMLTSIDSVIKQREGKLLLVVHMIGSHVDYDSRYTAEDMLFEPRYLDLADKGRTPVHQAALINSYDNSIRALDRFLESIYSMLDEETIPASVVYTSDHGENLFDDERELFLHASSHPTRYEVMVPLIVWANAKFHSERSNLIDNLRNHAGYSVSHRNVFPTLLSLSALQSVEKHRSLDLTDELFIQHLRSINNSNKPLAEYELR